MTEAAVVSFMGLGLVDPILPAIAHDLRASPSDVELAVDDKSGASAPTTIALAGLGRHPVRVRRARHDREPPAPTG